MKKSCLACDVVTGKIQPQGGILFQNDFITISHAVPPCQHRGFMIVEPNRHCEHIAALTHEEMQQVMFGLHAVSKAIMRALNPRKVYVCSFGETVKHVHFYVIPRYETMPARGVTVLNEILYERKWDCSDKEAEKTAYVIKKELLPFMKT